MPLSDEIEHPLAVADLGQGPRSEGGCTFGVTTELGQVRAKDRDRGRDVHQQAGGLARRRLERLIGSARVCVLGAID